jgi:hypothetical protein
MQAATPPMGGLFVAEYKYPLSNEWIAAGVRAYFKTLP